MENSKISFLKMGKFPKNSPKNPNGILNGKFPF